MSHAATQDSRIPAQSEWLTAVLIGCCLAAFVWQGILLGGGLVGGDVYPYLFPQKQIVAESFARGELPLWHDRTSLGYPLHAESQAGVFYPTNQILYRLLDVHSAYHVSLLLHYAAAYVFAWRFARTQWLSPASSLLAAMIFVYGWFPVRVSLEWSIIGGVWLPLCLWMVERLLQTPTVVRFTGLAVCLAIHLLSGHFALAFITQLTCLAYAFLRHSEISRWRAASLVGLAIAGSTLLAAVQLLPTLELHHVSQRDGTHAIFNPADGHMPPMYLTQLIASWWYWHTPEVAASRESLRYPFLLSNGDTNPVEAHLYLGLIPLMLLLSLFSRNLRHQIRRSNWRMWLGLSVASIIYAFGWLIPLTRHLPGFGYFIGPGRYTIITTLGLAVVAGLVLDAYLRHRRPIFRSIATLLIAAITLADVLASAQFPVADAVVVSSPPLAGLSESWLARTLQEEDKKSPVRLLAPGPNVANLLGVSSVPHYLGLGPAEYFSEAATVETQPAAPDQAFPSAEQMPRLKGLAVTHILTTESVATLSEECELVGSGPDAFLNRVWGRGSDACFLYRLKAPVQRVSSLPSTALKSLVFDDRRLCDVQFQIELLEAAEVQFMDLMYPGWEVLVDGQEQVPKTVSGFGRSVKLSAGPHRVRWVYRPKSFFYGATVSVMTLVGMCVVCVIWRR